MDLYEASKPPKEKTWIPKTVLRWLPSERYRAAIVLALGSIAGYFSGPVVAAFTDRWQFPIEAAQVEQLRRDVRDVPCAESQQVIARVIDENILIARKHAENALYYTDPFVTDHWNDVRLIQLPCGEEARK